MPTRSQTDTYETAMRNHGRGHSYKIDGIKVPGATTILKAGLPSNGLIKWTGESVADCAIDEWDRLAAMPPSERRKYMIKAPDRLRDTAGIQGTKVHKIAEPLAHGEQVEVPEPLAGHVESCVRFLDDWHVEPILTEFPVFSRRWMYAGCPDALVDVTRPEGAPRSQVLDSDDRWRVLIDWKTKKGGPFGTDAFQLAAYRWAEFRKDAADPEREIPWAWAKGDEHSGETLPLADECWIIWIRNDDYSVIPMETGPRVFKQFLYAKMIMEAWDDARDYRLDALTAPRRADAEVSA